LLKRFDRTRKGVALRFADQQVDVLRHYDIAIDTKSETTSDAFERDIEGALRHDRGEQWPTVITAERYKVSLSGFVETL
jgi:hypothetical protein